MTFAGTTLWFPETPDTCKYESKKRQFKVITSFKPWVYQRNQAAREFLASVDADVVITHHLPSFKSVAPQFQGNYDNCFYVSDVEDIIYARQPRYWLHGHTHANCDYYIGNTRVVANPYGYPQDNNKFNRRLILEID